MHEELGGICDMMSCRQASRLISESLEQPLPFSKRVSLRFHLLLCRLCRRFARDTRLFRRALRRYRDVDEGAGAGLSEQARERMKKALRDDENHV